MDILFQKEKVAAIFHYLKVTTISNQEITIVIDSMIGTIFPF